MRLSDSDSSRHRKSCYGPSMREIEKLVDRYLAMVDEAAPDLVTGVYLTGSAVLGDWIPGRSDIDLLYVLSRVPSAEDRRALETVHAQIPATPHVDGIYVPKQWL